MFGGNFNRRAFNRDLSIDVFLSASFYASSTLEAVTTTEIALTAAIHGAASLDADYIREVFASAELHGSGALDMAYVRERFLATGIHGSGTQFVEIDRYRARSIEITGPFAPGDKIVIDSAKLRVTKNGQIAAYDGDFFEINPGNNVLTYTDPATGRTVQMRVTWRDRYL